MLATKKIDLPGELDTRPAERAMILDLARLMRPRQVRGVVAFAEQEVMLPTGPHEGERIKLRDHSFGRLTLEEIDKNCWERIIGTYENQGGKTLFLFGIPTLWALFELRQTVICGVPSADMAQDKWNDDLLPLIRASRYRRYLPDSGGGSRGGNAIRYEFGNGAVLRFMTGGGGDQARAGMTAPRLHVTELEGFDTVGGSSREGTKLGQLRRRLLAFGSRAREISEGTVGSEDGATWQEYQHGSQGRICLPCPHCSEYVTPEREHLVGWQDAESEVEARERCCFCCPECGTQWTRDQRLEANRLAVLAHKGQTVTPKGEVVGDLPATSTGSIRGTVVNDALNPERVSMVGGLEWAARLAPDEDKAERDLRQSQWALPAKSNKAMVGDFDASAITRRQQKGLLRNVVPADAIGVVVGCDVGRHLCHLTAKAVRPAEDGGYSTHVVDHWMQEVPGDDDGLGVRRGLLAAFRQIADRLTGKGEDGEGRPLRFVRHGDEEGEPLIPAFVFVDCGYAQDLVFEAVDLLCEAMAEKGDAMLRAWPVKGFGARQRVQEQGEKTTLVAQHEGFQERSFDATGRRVLFAKADVWKSRVHRGLSGSPLAPGGMSLFEARDAEHLKFAKHLLAERQMEEFDPRHGWITRWEPVKGQTANHWLDSTALADCAASVIARRGIAESQGSRAPAAPAPGVTPASLPGRSDHW